MAMLSRFLKRKMAKENFGYGFLGDLCFNLRLRNIRITRFSRTGKRPLIIIIFDEPFGTMEAENLLIFNNSDDKPESNESSFGTPKIKNLQDEDKHEASTGLSFSSERSVRVLKKEPLRQSILKKNLSPSSMRNIPKDILEGMRPRKLVSFKESMKTVVIVENFKELNQKPKPSQWSPEFEQKLCASFMEEIIEREKAKEAEIQENREKKTQSQKKGCCKGLIMMVKAIIGLRNN